MKKIFALFLVMLLVLSGLSLSAVAEEDTLSGTLKYMFWGSTVERDIVEGICKSYMELHPNVTIETIYTPSDYDTKITTLAAANDLPDIAYMNALLATEMAQNGFIKDIGPLIEADPEITKDSFVPGCLLEREDGFVLGRRIGIAGYCMYYNEDMVKEAGLEPMPANWQDAMTWDEFIEYAKALTLDANGKHPDDEGFDPDNIVQYGFYFENWTLEQLIYAFAGVPFIDDDRTTFTLASEEGIAAVQAIADMINVYHVCPSPSVSDSLGGSVASLNNGMIATCFYGNWACADFAAAETPFNCGVTPLMPSADGYHAIEACGPTCIFENCQNPELAWDFYKYAVNLSYNDTFYSSGISIPVMRAWLEDPECVAQWTDNVAHPSGYVGSLLTPLLETPTFTPINESDRVFEGWSDISNLVSLDAVWNGERTAEEVLLELKPQVEAILAGK